MTLKANLKIDEKDKEFEYLVTVNAADENTNYKITFDTQGGTLVNTIKKKANEELTTPNDSVRNGYVFLGWYDSLENDEQFKFTKMPNKNVTLYAKWAKLENNNLKDLFFSYLDDSYYSLRVADININKDYSKGVFYIDENRNVYKFSTKYYVGNEYINSWYKDNMLYLHVESDNASESIYYSSQTYKFEDIVEVGGLLYYIYLPYYLKNSTSFNSIFDRNLTYSEVDNCFIYSFDSNTTRVVVRNYLRNGKIYKITYKFDFTIDINLYYDEEERSVPDIYDIEGYNFNRMYVATFVLPNGREFKLGPLYEMNYSYVYDSLSSFIQKSNISGLYFDKDYKNQLILTSYETYQLEEDITIYIKLKLASKFNYTFKFPNEHNFEIIGNGEYYNGEKITLRIKNVSDELKALVYQTVYDRLRKESFTILDYSVDANGIRFSFYASARNYTIEFNIPTN